MWKYNNPVKIYFGAGRFGELSSLAGGRTALITTPGFTKRGVVEKLKHALGASLVSVFDNVLPNPTFTSIKEAYSSLYPSGFNCILALGGGSTMDTAKAVAAMSASGDAGWLEARLKKGATFPEAFRPAPIISVPTTAGSGSEVTMWATVWDMENKKKYSLAHPMLFPEAAVLDPELTVTLPEKETVYSTLDALSHAMEAVWNKNSNPVSDLFSLEAIRLIQTNAQLIKNDLNNIKVRTELMRASLMAGLSFSNTQTAMAHSISYPLTAVFGIPHGLACSLPLPQLAFFNRDKKERMTHIADALNTVPEQVHERVTELFKALGVSSDLASYGVSAGDAGHICEEAAGSGRSGNNFKEITKEDLLKIIRNMIHGTTQ